MTWNQSRALARGRARTRDGRPVLNLREATDAHGRTLLVGEVAVHRPPYTRGAIPLQGGCWSSGGLGMNGDDDLTDEVNR